MTYAEAFRELDADIMENVATWWLNQRPMLERIAKWTIKLPRKKWFEYTSKRNNRYLVYNILYGRNYGKDSLTGIVALRKESKGGYTVYVTRFPWQRRIVPQVILPHVFDQYACPKRFNAKERGVELIKYFMERNNDGVVSYGDEFAGRSVRNIGRDNVSRCVTDGVLQGEYVDGIYVAHTFITYEMAKGLQREQFDKNRGGVLDNAELMRTIREEDRKENEQMKADILEAMR